MNGTGRDEDMDVLESVPEMGDVFVGNGSLPRPRRAALEEREGESGMGTISQAITAGWISGRGEVPPAPLGQTAAMWGNGEAEWADLPEVRERRTEEPGRKEESQPTPRAAEAVKIETHSEPLAGALRQAQILGSGVQPSQGRKHEHGED